ncbi:MAG: hypothetical protein U9M89_01190 [Patescibacteria group bacterium]|nr:hypothetical protein [Patescibacteria group bacterium]
MTNMQELFLPVMWLQETGHKAYLVGNQSRNAYLGLSSKNQDVDITTSASTSEVEAILKQNRIVPIKVNAKFGVVTFEWKKVEYEVATFREDIYDPQFDHIRRTPLEVIFHKQPTKDAVRRDFTVNAIYWNPKTNRFLDPTKGIKDLDNKILRFIGDPNLRIKEDPVRVLRAVRFKYSLGLKYAPTTKNALVRHGRLVHKLQPSLLKSEFNKIHNLKAYQSAKRDMQSFGVVLIV